MSLKPLAFVLLAACQQVVEEAVQPEDFAELAEAYCASHPELPCGHVYACEQPAENALGRIEICIPQFMDAASAEAVYGPCELSPDSRFVERGSWLCWWCCGMGCGAGCNAYNSCFCPQN